MWTAHTEQLERGRAIKTAVHHEAKPVAYAEVLRLWQDDAEFREWFLKLLADCPFSAFRWETPAITKATVNRPFEFVLLDSPGLARTPEVDAFAEHYARAADNVVEFTNLGRDAILIVPCPLAAESAYGHLAAFVRHAPPAQQHTLWARVGAAMRQRVSHKPVWLSTAGAGVSWLHVRLDDRPKYYGYAPYRAGVPASAGM
jgi:hypothetical protein